MSWDRIGKKKKKQYGCVQYYGKKKKKKSKKRTKRETGFGSTTKGNLLELGNLVDLGLQRNPSYTWITKF